MAVVLQRAVVADRDEVRFGVPGLASDGWSSGVGCMPMLSTGQIQAVQALEGGATGWWA